MEQICSNIVVTEINKEAILEVYKEYLVEKSQDRVRRMVSGMESIEVEDGSTLKGRIQY